MKFISKIDNVTFTSEVDLVSHLLKNFSLTLEEDNFSEIIDEIRYGVPYIDVKSVSKNEDGLLEIHVHVKDEHGDLLFSEIYYVGELNYYDISHYEYHDDVICENVKELIRHINSYHEELNFLKELLSSTDGISTYKIDSLNTITEYTSGGIYYEFAIGDKTISKYYDFGDSREELMNQVQSEFTKEIEGRVQNYWDSSANQQIFRVNGIELSHFLKDNVKVKITILD